MTTASLFAFATMSTVASACAWVIGLGRDITQHLLTVEECEAQGLPEGATLPAVHVAPLAGCPWWLVDCWTDEGDSSPGASCFNLKALGCHVEVFSTARRQEAAAA